MSKWIGKHPTSETPAGATYHFNRAAALAECVVVGFGIIEDTHNPGEFVINLMLVNPMNDKEYSVTSWVDEERTRPGWLEITEIPARP